MTIHDDILQELRQAARDHQDIELTMVIPSSEFGDYRISGRVLSVNATGVLIVPTVRGNVMPNWQRRWVLWSAVAVIGYCQPVEIAD